jgi:hypothetical protein
LIQKTVNLKIDAAFVELKAELFNRNYKLVSEAQPNQLVVKQGSVWGLSPTSAQKVMTYNLTSIDTGTQITCNSKLSSKWINLTVIGTAFSIVLVAVCFWIAWDLTVFVSSGQAGFWSWLGSISSITLRQRTQGLVNFLWILGIGLLVVILVESVVAVYAYRKVDRVADGVLTGLVKQKE